MSLPVTQGLQSAAEAHAALPRHREIDVAGRPPEAERRRSNAHADRAVRAVGAAVRVGAGNELARQHEALLGKIKVENAVAGSRVVRLLDLVEIRELLPDRRLLVVVLLAGEDEVIVGDGGLSRIDGVAAGDLIERVNRKRRRAVGGRQQIRIDAQRRAGPRPRRPCPRDAPRRSAPSSTSCARASASGNTHLRLARRPRRETRAAPSRKFRRSGGSRLPSRSAAPACRSCPGSGWRSAARPDRT